MDLVLRNATIVDGTGGARYSGDVAVSDGRIAAIGKVSDRGREEIDVGGAVVAPGFVDCHTHYDAQISWDKMLSPSVYHGVTSVIAGNCGFTLAPLTGRADDLDYLLRMLAVVEGMPVASLEQAVKPSWNSFGEFLDTFDGSLAINTAFMVGHTAIRRYVMGERAVGHEATAEELEAMVLLLRKSLAEGGMGFSTSTSVSHSDHMGDPVPSRWASEEELYTLARQLRDFPGTWVEIVPGVGPYTERENRIVTELSLASERPVNWNAFFVDANRVPYVESQLELNRYAASRGAKVWGLAQAAPIKGFQNFRSGFTLAMLDGWKPFLRLDTPGKVAALKDPEYRARLRASAEDPTNSFGAMKGLEHYNIEGVSGGANERWNQRPLAQFAAERGKDCFDALCDLAVEEDLQMAFSSPELGGDDASWKLREDVWEDKYTLLGGSDAGAHLDMINTFAITTQFLGDAVRDRGIYSLERGVQRVTSELADAFGLRDRGRIAQGQHADIVVFDPDTISCGPIAMRDDLPGGESRLYGDSVGIQHVIVNGVPVAKGNEPTGRVGGRVLRSGRDTYTIGLN